MKRLPRGMVRDFARFKIDRHLVAGGYGVRGGGALQYGEADVERVSVEDACEGLRDDARDSTRLDSDGGVFARRSAAEVAPGDKNVAALDTVGESGVDILHAVRRQFLRHGCVEVPRRDDDVRIHVVAVLVCFHSG